MCFGGAPLAARRQQAGGQRRRTPGGSVVVRAERDFYQILGVARDAGELAQPCKRAVCMPPRRPAPAAAPGAVTGCRCLPLRRPARPHACHPRPTALLAAPRPLLPADKKTIKSAYRQLARKFHPDVNKEADAEQRFKDISAAYEARAVASDCQCSRCCCLR